MLSKAELTTCRARSTPAAFTVVNDLVRSVTIPARATPALVNIRATDVHGTSPTGPPSWYRYL